MRIVLLGKDSEKFRIFLEEKGLTLLHTNEALPSPEIPLDPSDFLISYSYQHIIPASVLRFLNRAPINLHISYLPWNRGADPNIWSFLEGTPKGVTIHLINEGLDKGNILVQEKIDFNRTETLRTSYNSLKERIENLFYKNFDRILEGSIPSTPQPVGGSYHSIKDAKNFEPFLKDGWDTPVKDLPSLQNSKTPRS